MGLVRALDSGVISLERFLELFQGADLAPLDSIWDNILDRVSRSKR